MASTFSKMHTYFKAKVKTGIDERLKMYCTNKNTDALF